MKTHPIINRPQIIPPIGDRTVLCHLSGGAASALATMRCLQWYGADRLKLVYADTASESAGNHALLDSLERATGIPIHRLHQGIDIWDVFDSHRMMRMANGSCKAAVELKQKPLDAFTRSQYTADQVIIAVGLTWQEPKRQERLTRRLSPYQVLYPLNVTPRFTHSQILAAVCMCGLPISLAYNLGYKHDNCNGGCVLAGQRQWAALLDNNPLHFGYCEKREQLFHARNGFTILKDRRGGTTKKYLLSQLRMDKAAGRRFRQPRKDPNS